MSPQERSQDFLSDAEWDIEACKDAIRDAANFNAENGWDDLLDMTDQPSNPFAEEQWEMEKKKARQEQERNTRHSVDKGQECIEAGMTLITDVESDKYLRKVKKVSE